MSQLGIANVGILAGDGSRGWTERAPFDKTLVSAAAQRVPPALLEQLKPGGRMVLPLSPADAQRLTVLEKNPSGDVAAREIVPVRFTELEIA